MKEKLTKNKIGYLTGIAALFLSGYFFIGPVLHELIHLMVIWPSGCEYIFKPGLNLFTGFRASYDLGCAANPYMLGIFYFSGYIGTLILSLGVFYLSSKSNGLNKSLFSSLGTGILLSIVSSINLKGDIFNGLKAFNLEAHTNFLQTVLISIILLITLIEIERHQLQ